MEAFAAERAVVVQGLRMDFRVGGEAFTVLDIPEFDVLAQSATALVGPSGSGKTTLLNIITGILTPTEGRVVVDGVELGGLSAGQRDRFRAERIGYVFQTFNLIPPLTALENVLLPMTFSPRIPRAEQRARAQGLLERVGLGHRMHHRPPQLSHGEQQRVGIARALANRPQLIVADEPTASLEPGSAEAVVHLLVASCKEEGVTLLVATHDRNLLGFMDRVEEMWLLNARVLGGVR